MPTDPDTDPFRPPAATTEVGCLHCGEAYDSYRIEWRERADGQGFWCCPIPGCDGAGFGFDIFPTDPNWVDPEGKLVCRWHDDPREEELDTDLDGPPPPPVAYDPDSDIPF